MREQKEKELRNHLAKFIRENFDNRMIAATLTNTGNIDVHLVVDALVEIFKMYEQK